MLEQDVLPPPKPHSLSAPESVSLRPEAQRALTEILTRNGQREATPEDVVAQALEVLNVLTAHLSRKNTSVILHTQGESLRTLHIRNTAHTHPEGVKTVYKTNSYPKAQG